MEQSNPSQTPPLGVGGLYSVKGKEIGLKFLFKYCLNGHLRSFEIVEGELNGAQMKWLSSPNFPACEIIMRTIWMKEKGYRDKFDITVSPADISFDALWNLYDYKVGRIAAEKAFKKLTEADTIKCFVSAPHYKDHQNRKRLALAHLSTFINSKYYEDDWQRA